MIAAVLQEYFHLSLPLLIFCIFFASLTLLERMLNNFSAPRWLSKAWLANLQLGAFNAVLIKILGPISGVSIAYACSKHNIGLFQHLVLPVWASLSISLIFFDFAIYWQHRAFHYVPFLWNMHRVHHSDETLDVSSALRFHCFEILLSLLFKGIIIAALGMSPNAALIAEISLASNALFNHSNVILPTAFERTLRLVLVTPAMHQNHHNTQLNYSNSNFGFQLSIWDRLFTTWTNPLGTQKLGCLDKQGKQVRAIGFKHLLMLPLLKR